MNRGLTGRNCFNRDKSIVIEGWKISFSKLFIVFFTYIKIPPLNFTKYLNGKDLLLYNRWVWHLLFWTGYVLFRIWLYIITINHYPRIFLEYMLLSEILFVVATYFTIWLYKRFFDKKKYLVYCLIGGASRIIYRFARTSSQN